MKMGMKGMGGVMQNKMSKGMGSDKGMSGSGSIKKMEGMVGSSGPHGVRFTMPEGMVDHSMVRGTIGKE